MKKQLAGLLIVTIISLTGSSSIGEPAYMQLAAVPAQLPDGNWEYVYDVYGDSSGYVVGCGISGFDASLIANQWTYSWGGVTGTIAQQWEWLPANGQGTAEAFGSSSFDGTTWALHGQPWAVDNIWHTPDEYVKGAVSIPVPQWIYPGVVAGDELGVSFGTKLAAGNRVTGLMKTFRIIHPNSPGDINYWVQSYYGDSAGSGTITGPGSATGLEGDLDDDGDVDPDDVDILCANMGGDPGKYDLDEDGDVDEDDMIFLVENHLEWDSDGDGTPDGAGTFRGDFNVDGSVNGTDLSIMSGGFGTTTGFAGGNANCDTTVNGTDLSILSGVFGNVATAAIPEPLTMGLLSLGACLPLLRKRR